MTRNPASGPGPELCAPACLQAVFSACTKLFAQLPLAVVVAGTALVLHGGLPRAPPRRATRRSLPAAGAGKGLECRRWRHCILGFEARPPHHSAHSSCLLLPAAKRCR